MRASALVLLLAAAVAAALPVAPEDNEVLAARSATEDGNWALVTKILEECAEKDAAACLGAKAITAVRRAARLANIELMDGVALVRTGEDAQAEEGSAEEASEAELQRSLEEQPAEKTSRLVDLMFDAVARFFRTHSLQLSAPKEATAAVARALEEGRGKKKMLKTLLPLLLGVGAKLLLLIPVGIGFLGLVAAKALLVSKLALLLAGGIAVQKLLSGGGLGFGGKNGWSSGGSQGWSSGNTGGWAAGGGSGGWSSGPAAGAQGWSRSLDAHAMAYSAQAPPQPQQQ